MTQEERLLELFKENGNRLRRNDIFTRYKDECLSASYRQRISDLKKYLSGQGLTIKFYKENGISEWRIEAPKISACYDKLTGQGEFLDLVRDR